LFSIFVIKIYVTSDTTGKQKADTCHFEKGIIVQTFLSAQKLLGGHSEHTVYQP